MAINFNFTVDLQDATNILSMLNSCVTRSMIKTMEPGLSQKEIDWYEENIKYTKKIIAKIEATAKEVP